MGGGEIDWQRVRRVLIVKLRSIGDTVLSTPSLISLKRAAPDVEVDILLEERIAPVLDGFEFVDNVLTVGRTAADRLRTAMELRRRKYDVAFNLHGGTTAALLTRASGARHRYGMADYQYPFLHNHRASSAAEIWGRTVTHSAEQQLALLKFAGVPLPTPLPRTHLAVPDAAAAEIERRLTPLIGDRRFALMHPGTQLETKQWPTVNFARTAEFLVGKGLAVVAVGSQEERPILDELCRHSSVPIFAWEDLSLPETTAAAARAAIFIGNDSGMAHMAAAVRTPVVVIYGSSNRNHWSPWTDSPNEMVFREFHCQPCAGYTCNEFGEPRCILTIEPAQVFGAIDRLLETGTS